MNTELDDLYLNKVLNGDKEAFRYFVHMYQEMCYAIAISMVKNDGDAKDVLQNAFIKAYKGLRSFNREAKFATWLYRITVNESLLHIRTHKSKPPSLTFEEVAQVELSVSNDSLDLLDLKDKKRDIQRVLLQMKPKEALVLKLHYLQEYKISEIEKITGFANSHVKVLLHRSRRSFAVMFKKVDKV